MTTNCIYPSKYLCQTTKFFPKTKLKAYADNNLYISQMNEFVLDRVAKMREKGEKCWLPAFFLSSSKNVFKSFLPLGFKSWAMW